MQSQRPIKWLILKLELRQVNWDWHALKDGVLNSPTAREPESLIHLHDTQKGTSKCRERSTPFPNVCEYACEYEHD